jgi:predicted AAA+ superfamily ATPase
MTEDVPALLTRIAEALERLAPPDAVRPDFSTARLYRYEPGRQAFIAAPDYGLALDLLVGVERQKARFVENLGRFARGLPYNHALLWGSRGAGKSSMAKAAFMAVGQDYPALRMVELDRDEVAALPGLFEHLRGRDERFIAT